MADIDVDRDGAVLVVSLNRPDVRNAVDGPTARALAETFRDYDADPELSVAVLTGAGGAFCARAGLGTVILPSRNEKDYEEIPEAARNMLRFIWAERVEDVIAAALEPALPRALEPAAQ